MNDWKMSGGTIVSVVRCPKSFSLQYNLIYTDIIWGTYIWSSLDILIHILSRIFDKMVCILSHNNSAHRHYKDDLPYILKQLSICSSSLSWECSKFK